MKNAIITGHEIEITELQKQSASAETRALSIKLSGEGLAACGETLRLASLGLLEPVESIFGGTLSVADQVETAEIMVERHMGVLAKAFSRSVSKAA
jgi:hypothetical protein